jgi:hypothetical protein
VSQPSALTTTNTTDNLLKYNNNNNNMENILTAHVGFDKKFNETVKVVMKYPRYSPTWPKGVPVG